MGEGEDEEVNATDQVGHREDDDSEDREAVISCQGSFYLSHNYFSVCQQSG